MDKVAAAKTVSKLDQPEGMHAPTWKRLQKLLRALCRYLPNPYPGTRRLAKDTGIPWVTVKRLLAQAESLELLIRTPRVIPGHRDGYTYRLAWLDALQYGPVSGPVSDQTGPEGVLRTPSSTTKSYEELSRRMGAARTPPPGKAEAGKRKVNRWAGECAVCGLTVRPWEGLLHGSLPVHSFCDSGQPDPDQLREYLMNSRREFELQDAIDKNTGVIGAGDEPLVAKQVTKATPAQRLAAKFEETWITVCLAIHPEWKIHRCINTGAAIGYLNNAMLNKGYSEEYVEAYFDAFFEALMDPESELFMRESQKVWQLFCGWWGSEPVEDPAVERARRAQQRRWDEFANAKAKERREAQEPILERIEAAWARGEKPDPADIEAMGYKVRR